MLDPRVHAFRSDIADRRLHGRVEADRFVESRRRRVIDAAAPLRAQPNEGAATASELLFGEAFGVLEDRDGWSWGQSQTDGYVGYTPSRSLGEPDPEPTHRVTALGTFLYREPDMKTPPLAALSMGCLLALGGEVEVRDTVYRRVTGPGAGGAVVAAHVAPIGQVAENDFVAVAERFLNVPYLWGGRTSHGVDCSSLVQLALAAIGRPAPRDSDLQEQALGEPVEGGIDAALQPGDLVFWPGHVGIMIDGEYLLHASGHHMMVVIEPLDGAVARIGAKTGAPSAVKRF